MANDVMADSLARSQARWFVGRKRECALLDELLSDSPSRVLYISGPGGTGKSCLLHQLRVLADKQGIESVYLDARDVIAEPQLVSAAITAAVPTLLTTNQSTVNGLLLLDSLEYWDCLQHWFAHQLLPTLPDTLRIVIASRSEPVVSWLTHTAWRQVICHLSLPSFSDSEARRFLRGAQFPTQYHAQALAISRGHPLSLALITQLDLTASGNKLDLSSVMSDLAACYLNDALSAEQRQAMEAAAVALRLDEPLLRAMLQQPVRRLHHWLSQQTCISRTSEGLFPHDLLRQAVVEDLRQRDPQRYDELVARADQHLTERMKTATPENRLRLAYQSLFVNRATNVLQQSFEAEDAPLYADVASSTDLPALKAMTRCHEGHSGEENLAYWYRQQPESITVFRTPEQQPLGYMQVLYLDGDSDCGDDQLSRAWLGELSQLGIHSQTKFLCRRWMDATAYQQRSHVLKQVYVRMMTHHIMRFEDCVMGCVMPDDPPNRALAEASGHALLRTRGTLVAIHHYQPKHTIIDWLQTLHSRLRGGAGPAPTLARHEFDNALKMALKYFLKPAKLRDNKLLELALLGQPADDIFALRELLSQHTNQLAQATRTAPLAAVLDRTWLKPCSSQQAAAESLNISFSTYRRRLAQAVDLLGENIWEAEQRLLQE
ncbi:hypothetical protein G8764_02540 [Pseudomaricurvus alcaniphilus]|uniref:hypothetical protein n=1 Tax=Pseudomaricurvus alcaniphilus TaxID=1166482 RepID=UPI001409E486|nr:hypothetical protein [Pseudomaricurvus alcaniphilus]NHN36167.1 hypothetical protein [Pseudomaricurvus alcaniphilus]